MTLPYPFTGSETLAKEPIDQELFDEKVRQNIEYLDSVSGGGGGGSVGDAGARGEILAGGETNEAVFTKKRFHVTQSNLANSALKEGAEFGSHDIRRRLVHYESNDPTWVYAISTTGKAYLDQVIELAKDSSLSFFVEEGENYFSLIYEGTSTTCDAVDVKIDGTAIVTYTGIVDEDDVAQTNTFNSNSTISIAGYKEHYFGLDGHRHIITIKNTDSASKVFKLEGVEFGYRADSPTIDHAVKISAGLGSARGTTASFSESDLSFSPPAKSFSWGHTGAIKMNTGGTLTAVDGLSPAMTQTKPEEAISFSSAVTSLDVKNNWNFPASGLCEMTTPYGAKHIFSYTSKTDSSIQSHSLDGIIWQTQPTADFTPMGSLDSVTPGDSQMELNINHIGAGTIVVSASNNKIDFKVGENGGAQSTFAATITNGLYSADVLPLGAAIEEALNTAHAINNGGYKAKYDETTQRWMVMAHGPEVDSFELLFSSGANQANSIHGDLGYGDADLSASLSYVGTTTKQHLCQRVFEADKFLMEANDPRIKYPYTSTSAAIEADAVTEMLGFGPKTAYINSTTQGAIAIYPDHDCSGIALHFVQSFEAGAISVTVDNQQPVYPLNLEATASTAPTTSSVRGKIMSCFISFPRGTRSIWVQAENRVSFELTNNNQGFVFLGARQYFTKPNWESLTLTESIIKTIDIAPISLWASEHAHNTGTLYVPGSGDNINSITESGTWAGGLDGDAFNNYARTSTTTGAYVEVDFTLAGDGGGIGLKMSRFTNRSEYLSLYLSTAAIVEGTDLVQNIIAFQNPGYSNYDIFFFTGLPAGTYKARFKNNEATANTFGHTSIITIDDVQEEENKNINADVANNGQGVGYPLYTKRITPNRHSADRVPSYLEESGYREGDVMPVDIGIDVSAAFENFTESTSNFGKHPWHFASTVSLRTTASSLKFMGFMRSACIEDACFTSHETAVTATLDTRSYTAYSQRVCVKAGGVPTAIEANARLWQKRFKLACSFSASDTFTIADTRGLVEGQRAILDDGTNTEEVIITTIVSDTSFDVKKARATVVDANVTDVSFPGFHTIKFTQGSTSSFRSGSLAYEPLPLEPNKWFERNASGYKLETKTITFSGVVNNDDLYYPIHSDGNAGTYSTSSIDITGRSVISQTWSFPQDLKNVQISTGDIDVKITSSRWVPEL